MPITLNRNHGTNILAINNFSNVTIDAGAGFDVLPTQSGRQVRQ